MNSNNELILTKNPKETAMTFRQFLSRLSEIYKPFRSVVILLFAILMVYEGLNLVSPYIYGKIIDGIIGGKDMMSVMKLLLISFVIYIVNEMFLSYLKEAIEIKKLDMDVEKYVSGRTLKKVLGFSIGQHENQNSGIKKSVIDKGEHSLTALAFTFMYDLLPVIIHVVVATVALAILAPILGAIVFVGVVLYSALTIYINNIMRSDMKKRDEMYHDSSKKHGEILRNVSLVKINAKEDEMIEEYDKNYEKINNFTKDVWMRFIRFAHIKGFSMYLARISVMVVGIYLVYNGDYTPGSLVIFWSWSQNAFFELNHIDRVHRQAIEMYAAVKTYFILLDVEPDIKEIESPIVPSKIGGKIEFRNVSFQYPAREYIKQAEITAGGEVVKDKKKTQGEILRDVNIVVELGQKVAIVGPSGAGKSTIIQLLLRAYDPDKGGIFIDGNNLKDLDLGKFRSALGVVSQDIALFDNTLKYNVLFGVKEGEVSDEKIREVAKMACVDKFVERLEKGFDTIVGERGIRLSGGERQRVGIARALVKDPAILIFDEATSSLDTENEALIQKSIHQASEGRTTIIIAHRLSTIKDADKIIVMERGRVVGEGRHDELLETCETYKRLINNQTVVVVE